MTLKTTALVAVIILGLLVAFFTPPIPQDPQYHNFADQRNIFGIPNFWNVVTNLPFLMIGVIALLYGRPSTRSGPLITSYRIFFSGVFLVGFGSAYYHLQPANETLVWDRLPITIALMAFLAMIIGAYFSEHAETYLLLPLTLMGMDSVYYWHSTEQAGAGDLRLYALVQFLPMLLIPMIIFMFQPRHAPIKYIWLILGAYLMAKVLELLDIYIYNLTGFIGGHAIKHLFAALAPLLLFLALKKRI